MIDIRYNNPERYSYLNIIMRVDNSSINIETSQISRQTWIRLNEMKIRGKS
jgi:hypothetical protein